MDRRGNTGESRGGGEAGQHERQELNTSAGDAECCGDGDGGVTQVRVNGEHVRV